MKTEQAEEQHQGEDSNVTRIRIKKEMVDIPEEAVTVQDDGNIENMEEAMRAMKTELRDEQSEENETTDGDENEMLKMRRENQLLKAEIDEYRSEYLALARATEEEMSEMRIQSDAQMRELKEIKEKYETEYSTLVESTEQKLSEVREQGSKIMKEIVKVRNENQLEQAKNKSLKADADKCRSEYLVLARATEQQVAEIHIQLLLKVAEMNQMKLRLNELENKEEEENCRQHNINDLIPHWRSNNTFEWRVDHWYEEVFSFQNQFYSEPFYSHPSGYKMCLSLSPQSWDAGRGTHLGISFHLMKGPYDEYLSWPFNQNVTMSLINQRTGISGATFTAMFDKDPRNYYRHRPQQTRSKGIGHSQFVYLDELLSTQDLWRNDQLIIDCNVWGSH